MLPKLLEHRALRPLLVTGVRDEAFGILQQVLKVVYTFPCHPEGSEVRSFRVLLTPLTYVRVGERRGILTHEALRSLLRRDDKL